MFHFETSSEFNATLDEMRAGGGLSGPAVLFTFFMVPNVQMIDRSVDHYWALLQCVCVCVYCSFVTAILCWMVSWSFHFHDNSNASVLQGLFLCTCSIMRFLSDCLVVILIAAQKPDWLFRLLLLNLTIIIYLTSVSPRHCTHTPPNNMEVCTKAWKMCVCVCVQFVRLRSQQCLPLCLHSWEVCACGNSSNPIRSE